MCRIILNNQKKWFLLLSISILFLVNPNYGLNNKGTTKEKDGNINSLKELTALFTEPPNQYRSVPFWDWNDDITKAQIDEQLNDFKAKGIGGVFIHPRPGLITSYLSDDWFSLCAYAVKKGKELGIDAWLYDENSYPSGFAGGHVPAEMPESYNQGQGLLPQQVKKIPENANDFFLILKRDNSKFIDITNKFDEEKNNSGDYYLYKKTYYKNLSWYAGFSYVDLLYEGVTDKFIELTMDGYEKSIGSEFGKTIPGVFSDEPHINSSGGLRWTPSLFKDFEKRWGYDLKANLPSLTYEIGDWKRIRHNYYTTLLELFIERWSKPWFNYAEKNDLDWTGHYWEHEWPNPMNGSDNMAMYAWHQMPGIDLLFNNYSDETNAQLGNVRSVKELSSVANQMGKTRTLSETYGAAGWDLRFEDMKRIGDWEFALGVNFLNQHLSYMTIEGVRKGDHPPSFSYHEPWWKNYKVQTDYFARLSLALSSGEQVNNILVIEPTSTAWMYFSEITTNNKYSNLGPEFQKFVIQLEKEQIEYDLASENIVKNIGEIKGQTFVVGEREYDLVIIPPGLENLNKSTFELIKSYLMNGGKVISFDEIPSYVDGKTNNELKTIVAENSKQWISASSLTDEDTRDKLVSKTIQFQQPEKIGGKLFHHRREFKDGQILFLVNSSMDDWSKGSLIIKGKSIQELDLINGEIKTYNSKKNGNSLEIAFDLPPSGSLLLLISEESVNNTYNDQPGEIKFVKSSNELKIAKTDVNVLTLDYCNLSLGGKVEKDIYYYNVADKIFKHYGFDENPWQGVQYKSSIVDRNNFADRSGFEVSYPFLVDKELETNNFQVVVERPELWQILINGKRVTSDPSNHWLDRKFGVYSIGEHVNIGENSITIVATSMTVFSEVAPVYILGDFSLESQKKGWKLVSPKPIKLGSWKDQGYPFYSKNVSYTKSYSIKSNGKKKRYIVKLIDWYGSVAEVKINNKPAGIIAWRPNELDVTEYIREGNNEISIMISGTLKNLLGPHHIGPVTGEVRPHSFANGPKKMPSGNKYDFIDYGLFYDFFLIEAEGAPQKVYWKLEKVNVPVFSEIDFNSANGRNSISISTATEDAEIRYTLDGTEPIKSSNLYSKPVLLKKNSIVKARAFKNEFIASPIVERKYYIIKGKTKNIVKQNYIKGIEYFYYEGAWTEIPDYSFLTEISKGIIFDFNLDHLERRIANFAIEYIGYIKIEQDGNYNFYVSSNDGTKLFVNDILIVDNDGVHGTFEKTGQGKLSPGMHPFKLQYFDGGGSQSLKVEYKGPGVERQVIPSNVLFY